MDSFTQGLLGAAAAQLGFRQRIGRDATWVAFFAAASPDLDSLGARLLRTAAMGDQFTGIIVHRGITHSLLMVPVIAALFAVPWWLIRRQWQRGRAPNPSADTADAPPARARAAPLALLYACCFAAVLTHGLLDWCTSYGTQLFAPITNTRYAIDAVGIIDFIYTPILLLTLLVCYVLRKARPGRSARATTIVGWAGMLLSIGYLGAGRVMHDAAVRKALAHAGKGVRVVRADAYPTIGTIFLWRAVIETESDWRVVRVHHFAPAGRAPRMTVVPKAPPSEWIERARATRGYRVYDWFTNGRLRAEQAIRDGRRVVRFHDMRYAWDTAAAKSLWPLEVAFDDDGRVADVGRTRNFTGRSRWEALAGMWREIWNP